MTEDLKDILYTEEMILARVRELAARISHDYAATSPLMIGILKGSFIFLADLVRLIDFSCEIRFLAASSYGAQAFSSGKVNYDANLDFTPEERDIIIVEDILDTGITLLEVYKHILEHNPRSIKICCLLDKPSRRKVKINADYIGFECPDEFLVGYGLDYAERYRNIPFIASLKPEVYS